jgi:hypothetical protein
MHLDGYAGRPAGSELGRRRAGLEEQRAAGPWPRLCELLCRHHSERETGVDELRGQRLGRPGTAAHQLVRADAADVGHAIVDRREGPALEQVGRVHGVPGSAELAREAEHACGESLRVVKEQYFGHVCTP